MCGTSRSSEGGGGGGGEWGGHDRFEKLANGAGWKASWGLG